MNALKPFLKYLGYYGKPIGFWVIIYLTLPYIFHLAIGRGVLSAALLNISSDGNSPDNLSLATLRYEQETFNSPPPYSLINLNKTIDRLGILKRSDGTWTIFLTRYFPLVNPLAFPSRLNKEIYTEMALFSRLANCEESAVTFITLLNEKGVNTSAVRVVEDHRFAEYYNGRVWIAVDPSAYLVLPDKRQFAGGKNWSYLERMDFQTFVKSDVSDEYISRGLLVVRVVDGKGKPINKATVVVKSRYLMHTYPDRYNTPNVVFQNSTNETGEAIFKLGEKEYLIDVSHWLKSTSATANVTSGKATISTIMLTK